MAADPPDLPAIATLEGQVDSLMQRQTVEAQAFVWQDERGLEDQPGGEREATVGRGIAGDRALAGLWRIEREEKRYVRCRAI